jgi:hypothetical protein
MKIVDLLIDERLKVCVPSHLYSKYTEILLELVINQDLTNDQKIELMREQEKLEVILPL